MCVSCCWELSPTLCGCLQLVEEIKLLTEGKEQAEGRASAAEGQISKLEEKLQTAQASHVEQMLVRHLLAVSCQPALLLQLLNA